VIRLSLTGWHAVSEERHGHARRLDVSFVGRERERGCQLSRCSDRLVNSFDEDGGVTQDVIISASRLLQTGQRRVSELPESLGICRH
jgi:hypothetical protein